MPKIIARGVPEHTTDWPECGESEKPCYENYDDGKTAWSCTRATGHGGPHAGHYYGDGLNRVGLAWENEESVNKHEEVGALVDKAEVLMSLLGEPDKGNRQEMLLTAQTLAMLALVKSMSPTVKVEEELFAPGQPNAFPVLSSNGTLGHYMGTSPDAYLTEAARAFRCRKEDIKAAMRAVVYKVPDWENKKIQAIKELRTVTGLGLKDSKDIIDFASQTAHHKWWI